MALALESYTEDRCNASERLEQGCKRRHVVQMLMQVNRVAARSTTTLPTTCVYVCVCFGCVGCWPSLTSSQFLAAVQFGNRVIISLFLFFLFFLFFFFSFFFSRRVAKHRRKINGLFYFSIELLEWDGYVTLSQTHAFRSSPWDVSSATPHDAAQFEAAALPSAEIWERKEREEAPARAVHGLACIHTSRKPISSLGLLLAARWQRFDWLLNGANGANFESPVPERSCNGSGFPVCLRGLSLQFARVCQNAADRVNQIGWKSAPIPSSSANTASRYIRIIASRVSICSLWIAGIVTCLIVSLAAVVRLPTPHR